MVGFGQAVGPNMAAGVHDSRQAASPKKPDVAKFSQDLVGTVVERAQTPLVERWCFTEVEWVKDGSGF